MPICPMFIVLQTRMLVRIIEEKDMILLCRFFSLDAFCSVLLLICVISIGAPFDTVSGLGGMWWWLMLD